MKWKRVRYSDAKWTKCKCEVSWHELKGSESNSERSENEMIWSQEEWDENVMLWYTNTQPKTTQVYILYVLKLPYMPGIFWDKTLIFAVNWALKRFLMHLFKSTKDVHLLLFIRFKYF